MSHNDEHSLGGDFLGGFLIRTNSLRNLVVHNALHYEFLLSLDRFLRNDLVDRFAL